MVLKAKQISFKHRYVNVQFLNTGYVEMTKSWICNVKNLNNVLDSTLFITTDQYSYDAIVNFHVINILLVEYETDVNFNFGDKSYFNFICFRTNIIRNILFNNIAVWLTESDAIWFVSAFEHVAINTDVILVHNNAKHALDTDISGGMLFLSPTKYVKISWEQLLEWEIKHSCSKNEMQVLHIFLKNDNISRKWLPNKEYVSGQWYNSKKFHTGKEKLFKTIILLEIVQK